MTGRSDERDVAALYRRFGPMSLRRAQRFLPPHEAEEVLQDMFLKLIANPALIPADLAPAAWLHRVVTRMCIDRLRASRRYASLVERHERDAFVESDSGLVAEARAFLASLWARIDPELVHIGVLYYLDGLTTAAIGRELGVSDRTIANRLKQLAAEARAASESGPAGGGAPP
ncbi:MAG: sigma-70 family RNA polymerase sigma factor [Myxococcota bacterium]